MFRAAGRRGYMPDIVNGMGRRRALLRVPLTLRWHAAPTFVIFHCYVMPRYDDGEMALSADYAY